MQKYFEDISTVTKRDMVHFCRGRIQKMHMKADMFPVCFNIKAKSTIFFNSSIELFGKPSHLAYKNFNVCIWLKFQYLR